MFADIVLVGEAETEMRSLIFTELASRTEMAHR